MASDPKELPEMDIQQWPEDRWPEFSVNSSVDSSIGGGDWPLILRTLAERTFGFILLGVSVE